MTQLDFPKAARADAFSLAMETSVGRRQKVLEILTQFPDGATADELALKLGWPPYQVRPRLTELCKAEKIKAVGRRAGLVSSVRITVWRAA